MIKDTNNGMKKYNKPNPFNAGVILFGVIFVYFIIYFVTSFNSTPINGYQVKKGTLAENRTYSAIAIRDEKIEVAPNSGYVSLFVREGERVAKGNMVYAIDESGKLSDATGNDPNKDNSLSASEITDIKQQLLLFAKSFDKDRFFETYSFENRIRNDINKIKNRKLLDNIDDINSLHLNDIVNFYYSNGTGIVTFFYDGFEQLKPADLSVSDFDINRYEEKSVMNDSLIESGNFVYKYTNNENWSLCILVNNDELLRLADSDYLKVKFLKTQTESWGKVTVVKSTPEGTIVELSFTNSMISFCTDRFVDIELIIEDENGLKIPNSSIAEKNFYLIDKNYVVTKVDDNSVLGVNRKVISNSGDVTSQFMELKVYGETEDEYYVDTSALNIGDIIYYSPSLSDSPDMDIKNEFTVGKQGTLIGVYNINKGYADFRRIEILYSNNEYSIIKPNDSLGLNPYDYIALDAKTVNDKDFIY